MFTNKFLSFILLHLRNVFKIILHIFYNFYYYYLQSGFIAALPYLVQLVLTNVFSYLADYFCANKHLTIGQTRKIFNAAGI